MPLYWNMLWSLSLPYFVVQCMNSNCDVTPKLNFIIVIFCLTELIECNYSSSSDAEAFWVCSKDHQLLSTGKVHIETRPWWGQQDVSFITLSSKGKHSHINTEKIIRKCRDGVRTLFWRASLVGVNPWRKLDLISWVYAKAQTCFL